METLRVLVTDDEPGMRAGVARALANARVHVPETGAEIGFAVEQAETGEEALAAIARGAPDLLLLDHKMPGLSGLEVLEKLAERPADMLTVMITAYASIETAVVATRRGAFDFLAKPFTPEELRETVGKAATRLVLARQARRLAEQNRQVRFEFVRVLGHELKAPIAAVSGLLDLARTRALGESLAAYDEPLARAHARLAGMSALIRDLLDLTRIESGQKRRELARVDAREAVRAALDGVRAGAADRGIALELRAEGDTVMQADAGELEMIANNLLTNAVKYNRDGGRVEVALGRAGSHVVLEVRDTGIGMTPEVLARAFEEFSRARTAETAHIEGSGLGLSIVRKLVQLYGGRASARSEPGRGTTVTVVLHDGIADRRDAGD